VATAAPQQGNREDQERDRSQQMAEGAKRLLLPFLGVECWRNTALCSPLRSAA
jgi:hypothetical protein